MWTFAWRNLATRPLRTILALVGLSIPILGVLGLFSLSGGMRNLVGATLSQIQGAMILREGQPSPVFSDLPADLADTIRKVPGVSAVAPEVWKIAPSVEGQTLFGKTVKGLGSGGGSSQVARSLFDQVVIQGQDIVAHQGLKSAVFPKAMIKGPEGGRFLLPEDRGKNRVVISSKIAHDYPDPKTGKPHKVGDSLRIGNERFEIIGLYNTNSLVLDGVALMDIDTARKLLNVSKDKVSSIYVEATDPAKIDQVCENIEKAAPGVDARGVNEILSNFGDLMDQLDHFLFATVALALMVGVVGIINTMLMSTTERFGEFGVLRTNGWSRSNVLTLVTAESAYLGLLAGIVGFVLALVFTTVANQFITSTGLKLTITPWNALGGLTLSIVMGTLGGLYPAWKASRLVPMDAIRLGTR
ncbi:MAG: ABC-type transport system, involved in lipoprotein release, permease component [Planctomycetota bacterium]|nr:ABC-type transport system, involved in lipoprotein release, permease component [Planctomycetota bacterium]